jgi:hypothetical protein
LPWSELEDLQHAAARSSQPTDPALRLLGVHAEERAHLLGVTLSDDDEPAAEVLGVELNKPVEVGYGDGHPAAHLGHPRRF